MFWLITRIAQAMAQSQPSPFDEAMGVGYCEAVELDPKDAWGYVNLGWLYYRVGRLGDYDQIRLAKPTEKSRQVSASVLFAT